MVSKKLYKTYSHNKELKENERSFEVRGQRQRELHKGQANKSIRRMPWHQEPKKDVTSCDKPRGGANIHRAVDFRMGKPAGAILRHIMVNKIVIMRETR